MVEKNIQSLKEYRAFMILKNYSPRTVKTYYQNLHYFLEYCENVFPDKEMCDDLVLEYLLHRIEMKLDWQTVNSYYSSFKILENFFISSMEFTEITKTYERKINKLNLYKRSYKIIAQLNLNSYFYRKKASCPNP